MENKLGYQMNVFAPTEEIKGRKVLPANTESFSGIIDASVSGSVAPATPMKIVSTSAKLPHFAPAASDSDNIIGFLEWNVIRSGYVAGIHSRSVKIAVNYLVGFCISIDDVAGNLVDSHTVVGGQSRVGDRLVLTSLYLERIKIN